MKETFSAPRRHHENASRTIQDGKDKLFPANEEKEEVVERKDCSVIPRDCIKRESFFCRSHEQKRYKKYLF